MRIFCALQLNRGFAIMLVLMMLFLLFMLGVAFFFSAWTHAFMARNYLNMKRAFVVAEGGVWHAIGNIIGDFSWVMHAQNKPIDYRWKYWGDVEPGTPEPNLVEITKTSVEYAQYPSYAMPKTIEVFGEKVGLSGVMDPGGGAYGINSDIFHLKVNECSAQLYVNEGLGHPYNTAVMQRMLNRLEEQVLELGYGEGTLGKIIMQKRPPDGYKTKLELREKLGEKLYEKFKDFLCVHTYSDHKVANPVPLSWEARDAYDPELYQTRPGYPTNTITRYGRGRINYPFGEIETTIDQANRVGKINQPSGSDAFPINKTPMLFYGDHTEIGETFVYAWQELNPCWIEVTSRAPVNINTAPREILVALLEGLQGFFVLEQLRTSDPTLSIICVAGDCLRFTHPVPEPGLFFTHEGIPSSSAIQNLPGEIGILFKTEPVTGRTATEIADAIIARRTRQPFTTWQDFNDFIDGLVWLPDRDTQLITDSRGSGELNFFNPDWSSLYWTCAKYELLEWGMYRYYASQAIADTIKANFNPNLHLNELNPNASIYTMVDKTDLIKNSTEFCFLPTGYFEIESVGQILRAEWEDGRFHISPYLLIMKDSFEHNNQIMGQRRLKVVLKLWDLYRQTVQQDFMAGSYSSNRSQFHTNLNLACESGPEVANGYAPFQNRYEGYVQLSTYGGSMGLKDRWLKGKLYTTSDFPDTWQEEATATHDDKMGMHAHLDFDFRLHKSRSYPRPLNDLEGSSPPAEVGDYAWGVPNKTERYDDSTAKLRPPYASIHRDSRLCRSYEYTKEDLMYVDELFTPEAPHDQRMDGFYAERFSMIPYYPRGGNFNSRKGVISYWIKPGFAPELHGYHRTFFSLSMGKVIIPALQIPGRMDHMWGWSIGFTERSESVPKTPFLHGTAGPTPLVPYSMLFNIDRKNPFFSEYYMRVYTTFTPTLNHRFHGYQDSYEWPGGHIPGRELTNNIFNSRRWVHVILPYRNEKGKPACSRLIVNGRWWSLPYPYDYGVKDWPTPDYTTDLNGELNPLMLGGDRWRKFSANSTIDEFHVATDVALEQGRVTEPCPRCKATRLVRCPQNCRYKLVMGVIGPDGDDPCTVCGATGICPKCGGDGIMEDIGWCFRCRHGFGFCACPSKGDCNRIDNKCIDYGCYYCLTRGSGSEGWGITPGDGKCRVCEGDGKVKYCPVCNGTGYVTCPECQGNGKVIKIREYPMPFAWLRSQWWRGRYYRENDAAFTSGQIDLGKLIERVAAEPNRIKDPYGHNRWRNDEGLTKDQTKVWLKLTWYHPKVKILGVTWTGYTWDVQDHRPTENGGPAEWLDAQLELSLERKEGNSWLHIAGPWLNADAGWAPVMVQLPRNQPEIRYRVRFNTRCDPLNAILLETPILDDVTIYWMDRPKFLSWVEGY
jgi:hypothetical protein